MGTGAVARKAVARWVNGRLPELLRARGVERAYLFGSWARGDADDLSDIDVLIVAPSRRPFVERFRDYPDVLDAPTGIDMIIYTPDEFTRERRLNRFVRHVMKHARRIA